MGIRSVRVCLGQKMAQKKRNGAAASVGLGSASPFGYLHSSRVRPGCQFYCWKVNAAVIVLIVRCGLGQFRGFVYTNDMARVL